MKGTPEFGVPFMRTAPLYRRALGEEFESLSPILQHFHDLPIGGCATGVVTVERAPGYIHQLAARLLRLPPEGENIPLRLQVVCEDDRERWIRHFGDYCLETVQWQEGPLLIEKAGPMQFGFRLSVDDCALVFRQEFCRLWGLSIPRLLALTIGATVYAHNDDWQVEVVIGAPLLGTITTYLGEVSADLAC